MQTSLEIFNESKNRVRAMQFGDPVTNICAGEVNPTRLSWFVEYVVHGHRNRSGIVHNDYWAKCTDRKGRFWNTDIEVIYPGHLDYKTCNKLFAPVHAAKYGAATA